jgi:putative ABC transport system permease protein
LEQHENYPMHLYLIKSALQILRSSLRYTLLNLVSLALGLSITILMVMLIRYEWSFDKFHPKRDSIVQVIEHDLKSGDYSASCPLPLPSVILDEFPEVKHATGVERMIYPNSAVTWKDREYSGFTGASVDTGFFRIFGYRLLSGNSDRVLEAPGQVMVSERFAQKVFGDDVPLGQVISIRDHPLIVSGVYRDLPDNSSVRFDMLLSEKARALIRLDYKEAWWNGGMKVYVILQPGSSPEAFEKHLQEIPDAHYPDFLKGRSTFTTRPFKGSHFDTDVRDFDPPPVPRSYLFILASITLVTLLIACINYINLSTAQAARRNIDSGIRRILGARTGHILFLHLWIAFLSVAAGLAVALVVCMLAMPFFETLTQKPVGEQFSEPLVWIMIAGVVLMTGLVTGLVPGRAFVRGEPVQIIRARGLSGIRSRTTREGLVVFQFALTIAFIIVQLFIFRQISYMKNADLGFDNKNLLAIDVGMIDDSHGEAYDRVKSYREEAEQQMAGYGFGRGSITENIPGYYYQNSFILVPTDAVVDEFVVTSTAVDEYFTRVYGIKMVEGRFFSPEYRTDEDAFIINETAKKKLGWGSIDGKFVKWHHEGQPFPVIGVMADIHTSSLREPIRPMVYRFGDQNNFPGFITFRVSPLKRKETVEYLGSVWQKMFPDLPFVHFYVKEKYFENYTEEKRLSRIIGSLTLIAICLSILGLVGLVSFMAGQRQKEIGIRKVTGAGSGVIWFMMNRVFMKWLLLAFFFASPVAWYIVRRWLREFAYHVGISPLIFLLAGFMALLIVLITVSWQSWKAAGRNPVESLRYE